MKKLTYLILIALVTILASCDEKRDTTVDKMGFTAPTDFTAKSNDEVLKSLPIDDQQDFIEANRGLIASDKDLKVVNPDIGTVWDQTAYEFIKGEAPASVNPSLWRQAKLNNIHGLFEVTKGIYQLRGFDLSNMTIIEGKTGWIIVDPLTSIETAKRAIKFARKHLEEKPIVAIIFTHSHIDHFGGVTGIISAEEAKRQNIRLIAPIGFIEEAVSENIIAGTGMIRRALYMYGSRLPRTERGHVGTGLGKEPAMGLVSILEPNEIITKTPEKKTIDGVQFIFQNAPDSEAPAELTFYLPELNAFCGAEVVSRNMHNLLTLRGAKVRDTLKWTSYIQEIIDLFGKSDIYFASHHWPIWGNDRIIDFLKKQRDIYKYIHDQTVKMANEGLTPIEIAEQMDYPETLRTSFSNRGYYGTLSHNSKAVYQFYYGWYTGNPAQLNPLPPTESAKRHIEYMGGADNVLVKAQASFDKGDYRWVAEILNHLVFADPGNKNAKALLAKTYDQLGYQAESGPWRDIYLTGAYELRYGAPEKGMDLSNAIDMLKHVPLSRYLDAMSVRLNGPKADGKDITVNLVFTDINESYVLHIENSVLHHKKAAPDSKANATVALTHDLYMQMATGKAGVKDILLSDKVKLTGSKVDLIRFFALFDLPKGKFNIVTP